MRRAVFVVAGRLDARTGGSIYNARMTTALRARGWAVDVRELDGDFPTPSSAAVAAAAAMLTAVADDSIVLVDGLAYGAMPDVVTEHGARLRLIALVHMSLADEFGIDAAEAATRAAAERRALSAASEVVVTGRTMIDVMSARGVPVDRITVVTPGTDRMPAARGSDGSVVQLLCVSALTPGKGHDVLLRALAENRSHQWHLTCVGSTTRSAATVAALRHLVRERDLGTRVTFLGELGGSSLDAQFDRADVFVLATLRETFGMAVAEALARGIPVISTATGEIPFLVGDSAGIVVPAGNSDALAVALKRLLADAALRMKLQAGAIDARDRLTTWDEAASTMAAVLERAANRRSAGFRSNGE